MAQQLLMTTGEIADELGVSRDRIEYLVKSRNIVPDTRAGKYRLFSKDQLEQIRQIHNNPKTPAPPVASTQFVRGAGGAGTGATFN